MQITNFHFCIQISLNGSFHDQPRSSHNQHSALEYSTCNLEQESIAMYNALANK